MSKQYPIHLFLDLEETIIDNWESKNIINIDKIKNTIDYSNPDHLHIYSAAIWDSNDVTEFNNKLRDNLEILLKRKLIRSYQWNMLKNVQIGFRMICQFKNSY